MNEETQVTTTEEDSWNDITLDDADVSDEDVTVEDDVVEQETDDVEETAPETDEADPADQPEGEADKDETETKETEETDQFTLKYLGEEKSVSREEIVPLAQKGMDYDRVRQKLETLETEHTTLQADKAKVDESLSFLNELATAQGFPNVDAFLDETRANMIANKESIDISIARGRVANERSAKELATEKAKIAAEQAKKDTTEQDAKKAKEQQQADFLAFANEYPNVKPEDIPNEVWKAVKGGQSLLSAYIKHENTQLKAKLAADKKNYENKKRSTGSRASVGKVPKQDDFDKLWYDGD